MTTHIHKPAGRIYVKELGEIIDRSIHTIRWWEKDGLLPRDCMAKRDERGWRYWTPEQVDRIVRWMEETRAGQSEHKLATLRAPRDPRKTEDEEEPPKYHWYIYRYGTREFLNGPFTSGRDCVDTCDLIEGPLELRRCLAADESPDSFTVSVSDG